MSELQTWLKQNKAVDNTIIKEISENFRTVYSNEIIEKDKPVLSVPLKCIIYESFAYNSESVKPYLSLGLDNSHVILAICLLYEKSLGEKSTFYNYIQYLPTSFSSHPLFLSDTDIELFNGSGFYQKLKNKKKELLKSYELLKTKNFPYTFEEYMWARTIIITRVFQITIDGKKESALVPLADMLNHKNPEDVKTNWFYDEKKGSFDIVAKKTIKKGEELFDTYGHKCNYRFVVNYGFFLENNREYEEILLDFDKFGFNQILFKCRPLKTIDNYENKYTITTFYEHFRKKNYSFENITFLLNTVTHRTKIILENILKNVKDRFTNYSEKYSLDWNVYNMINSEYILCNEFHYFCNVVSELIKNPQNNKKIKKKIKSYFADEILYFFKKENL